MNSIYMLSNINLNFFTNFNQDFSLNWIIIRKNSSKCQFWIRTYTDELFEEKDSGTKCTHKILMVSKGLLIVSHCYEVCSLCTQEQQWRHKVHEVLGWWKISVKVNRRQNCFCHLSIEKSWWKNLKENWIWKIERTIQKVQKLHI